MKFLVEITENGFTKVSPVPARMGMGEAAAILGISKTDLSHLCATGELELIGEPERNQERYLYADDVLERARDKGSSGLPMRCTATMGHGTARHKETLPVCTGRVLYFGTRSR